MKRMKTTGAIALLCAVTMGGGCAGKKSDPMATNAGVTDISAVPPAPTPIAMEPVAAPVAEPVVSDAPTQAAAPAPGAATSGGTYTVQKGDTLWKIATASYGNGNQWQRIASANPGLSPSTLKVGQTITIP